MSFFGGSALNIAKELAVSNWAEEVAEDRSGTPLALAMWSLNFNLQLAESTGDTTRFSVVELHL